MASYFKPRFPRAVNGEPYRTPYDDDNEVETLSVLMSGIYSDHDLSADDRARLLQLHRDLNSEHALRRMARRDGQRPDGSRFEAISSRFLTFARRVGASSREIESLDDI